MSQLNPLYWICEHNEHAVYSACCFCVVTHTSALWLAEVVVWSKGCYLRAGTFQEKCRHEGKSLSRVPAVAGQAEWMFIIHVKWKDSGRTACPYASILQSYVNVEFNNHVQLSVCFYSLLPGQAFMGGPHLSCAWWVSYCTLVGIFCHMTCDKMLKGCIWSVSFKKNQRIIAT